MRKVAFRAWHKADKQMYRVVALYLGRHEQSVSLMEDDASAFYSFTCPLADVELMQFTGLKDRLGKEIWEGDIIKHPPYWHDDREVHAVKDIHMFCGDYGSYGDIETEIEVISNIYENQELLKEAQ